MDALVKATQTLADTTSAIQRQQRMAQQEAAQRRREADVDRRIELQEWNALQSARRQQFSQGVQLYQLRRQAEQDYESQLQQAVQLILGRLDKANAAGMDVSRMRQQALEKLIPSVQQAEQNRRISAALTEAAAAFDYRYGDESFLASDPAGARKFQHFINYGANPKTNNNVADLKESLGPYAVYFDRFIRDYAALPAASRSGAVQAFMDKNGVQEALNPAQIQPLLQEIASIQLPGEDPREKALLAQATSVFQYPSKDAYVQEKLGPYAQYAGGAPSGGGVPAGGGAAPPQPSPGHQQYPLTQETSGEITGPVMKTGEGTYTNILSGPVEGVNQKYLEKYQSLVDLTNKLQGAEPAAAPAPQPTTVGKFDPDNTAAPRGGLGLGGRDIGSVDVTGTGAPPPADYSSKLATWTQTPGFKNVMLDVLTGAVDANDVMERVYAAAEAVYKASGQPMDPSAVKNTASLMFSAVKNTGLLNERGFPNPQRNLMRAP